MINFFKKKVAITATAFILSLTVTGICFGGVSPEEASQLGKTLTPFGAEKAGNKEGTIPEYTGGLTKAPADFVPGSGFRTDPFKSEKPLFSIDATNMEQYGDKLTDGTKYLMKQFPTYRIDVYPTHRTTAYPEFVLENSVKNATRASTEAGGLNVTGAKAGVPFPIPKTGYEVLWNHLMHYQGVTRHSKFYTDLVDATGRMYGVSSIEHWEYWPYYDLNVDSDHPFNENYFMHRWLFLTPARKAGEGGRANDKFTSNGMKKDAWLYLPGQRRVKRAPQVGFDTPSSDGNGNFTYDETWLFNGSMQRYDVKLIGKKEMYVPYNCYRAQYVEDKSNYYQTRHVNPDVVRYELHRVWVIEADLKPDARHIYKKRRMYIDEDSWTILAQELYDAGDKMFKIGYMMFTQSYDITAPNGLTFQIYNLNNGVYLAVYPTSHDGYMKEDEIHPPTWWSPEKLAGSGIR